MDGNENYFFHTETKFWKRRPFAFALVGSAIAFTLSAALYALLASTVISPIADDLPESSSELKAAVVTTVKPEQREAVTIESTANKPQRAGSKPFFSVDEKPRLDMNEPGMPDADGFVPPTDAPEMYARQVETDELAAPPPIVHTPLGLAIEPYLRSLKNFDELVSTAKYHREFRIRLSALSVIAEYENREAIDALVEFTDDANADIRFDAYNRLWGLAAEGHDEDGGIPPVLQQAMNHSEPRIAAFAKKALQDLADRASGKFQPVPSPSPPPEELQEGPPPELPTDDPNFPEGLPPHLLDNPPTHPPQ